MRKASRANAPASATPKCREQSRCALSSMSLVMRVMSSCEMLCSDVPVTTVVVSPQLSSWGGEKVMKREAAALRDPNTAWCRSPPPQPQTSKPGVLAGAITPIEQPRDSTAGSALQEIPGRGSVLRSTSPPHAHDAAESGSASGRHSVSRQIPSLAGPEPTCPAPS